jgi:hypothetical protein
LGSSNMLSPTPLRIKNSQLSYQNKPDVT